MPAVGTLTVTRGLAGEAGALQLVAQVPNRPNCWNSCSTGGPLSAAAGMTVEGMAATNASTRTTAIRMMPPLHDSNLWSRRIAARHVTAIGENAECRR